MRPPCFGSVHNGREDFPRATFKRRITAVSVISDKGSSPPSPGKTISPSAQVWIADMRLFEDHNCVWNEWVDPANPPARACLSILTGGLIRLTYHVKRCRLAK